MLSGTRPRGSSFRKDCEQFIVGILRMRKKVKVWRFILGTSEHRHGHPTRMKVVGPDVPHCYAGCDDRSLQSLH